MAKAQIYDIKKMREQAANRKKMREVQKELAYIDNLKNEAKAEIDGELKRLNYATVSEQKQAIDNDVLPFIENDANIPDWIKEYYRSMSKALGIVEGGFEEIKSTMIDPDFINKDGSFNDKAMVDFLNNFRTQLVEFKKVYDVDAKARAAKVNSEEVVELKITDPLKLFSKPNISSKMKFAAIYLSWLKNMEITEVSIYLMSKFIYMILGERGDSYIDSIENV